MPSAEIPGGKQGSPSNASDDGRTHAATNGPTHPRDDGISDAPAVEPTSSGEGASTSVPNAEVQGRTVSFSTLAMREYPIIVGQNPAVMLGAPLTIDWTYGGEVTCSVDDYEKTRPKPRSMIELRIPASMRNDILKRSGYSRNEIMAGIKQANIGRNRRQRTKETMGLSSIEETMEIVTRAVLNVTLRRQRKKKEREFLADYKILCQKDSDHDATVEAESCCSLTTS